MERLNDIEFLEDLRQEIDEYLFLGYARSEESWGYAWRSEMRERLDNSVTFRELRRQINEMAPRVHQLLGELHIDNILVEYPAPAIGGPVRKFKLFNLVTQNPTSRRISKEGFLDRIDQAIGALKVESSSKSKPEIETARSSIREGFVFIAMPMGEDDPGLEDVHDAIKETAKKYDLIAERIDDPVSNERITLRIVKSLAEAQFVVADLTHSKPNVYFQAGYADGTGKIPIYIAKEGTKIEFDVKDYPVIFFKNMKELKRKLGSRLENLTGEST